MIGDVYVVGIACWKTQQIAKHFTFLLAKCLVILQAVELNVVTKVPWSKFVYSLLEISKGLRAWCRTLVSQLNLSLPET